MFSIANIFLSFSRLKGYLPTSLALLQTQIYENIFDAENSAAYLYIDLAQRGTVLRHLTKETMMHL